MSLGNGYLTGNMLIAFPFEDGKYISWEGGDSNTLQLALQKCFVDASIYIDSQEIDGDWPAIGMFSTTENMLLFRISACGSEIPLSASAQSERFPIISGKASWGSYTIVLSSEGIREFLSISPPVLTSSSAGRDGVYLPLCAKCVSVKPAGLNSLMVYDGVHEFSAGPHFVLKGDVSVKPGNNVLISEPAEDSDGNQQNGMELSAVPGSGIGQIPCQCIESANGNILISGPDGHARIFNDTCYDLEPGPIGTRVIDGRTVTSRQLLMHVKCTSCCTCQMYESIVNDRLAPLADAIRKSRSDISSYYSMYEQAVKKFNKRINEVALSDIKLSLSGMPIGGKLSPKIGGSKVRGKMSRCAFTAIICNSSFFEVRASINSIIGTDSVIEATAAWTDEYGEPLSRTGDTASSVFGSYVVYPGRSLVVTFISVKDTMSGSVATGGYSGSIYVGLSYRDKSGDIKSLGYLQKTVSV